MWYTIVSVGFLGRLLAEQASCWKYFPPGAGSAATIKPEVIDRPVLGTMGVLRQYRHCPKDEKRQGRAWSPCSCNTHNIPPIKREHLFGALVCPLIWMFLCHFVRGQTPSVSLPPKALLSLHPQ